MIGMSLKCAARVGRAFGKRLLLGGAVGAVSVGAFAGETLAQDLPLPVAEIERSEPIDFNTEIMPILRRKCLACHHSGEAEAGLNLERYSTVTSGGDSGDGIVAKDPSASLVFTRAAGIEEPLMPPEDNGVGADPLTPQELGLLKRWIEQGAAGTDAEPELAMQWEPIPATVRPTYALEVSRDGRLAAFGRGNRAYVVDLQHPDRVTPLVDPALAPERVAGVDLVQSIAFSPDGMRVAAGGFRTVRIWERELTGLVATGTPLSQARGPIAQTADGSLAALVNAIGDIELWNPRTQEALRTLPATAEPTVAVAVVKQGEEVIVADEAGHVVVWDAKEGGKIAEAALQKSLVRMAASADGTQLVAITQTGEVILMRQVPAAEGQAARLEVVQEKWLDIADATDVVFVTQPQPAVAVATRGNVVKVAAPETSQVVQQVELPAGASALDATVAGDRLAVGLVDGSVLLWDLQAGSSPGTLRGTVRSRLLLEQTENDVAAQQTVLTKLNGRTAGLEALLKKENEALAKATEQRDQAVGALKEQQGKHEQAVQAVAASEQAIAEAKAVMTAGAAAIPELEGKVASQMSAVEKLAAEIAAKQKMLEAMQAEAKATREALAARQQETQQATELVTAKTKELEGQRKAVEEAAKAVTAGEAEVTKKEQALAAATGAQQLAAAEVPRHQAEISAEDRRLQRLQAEQVLAKQRHEAGAAVRDVSFDPQGRHVAVLLSDGGLHCYRTDDRLALADWQTRVGVAPSGLAWQDETMVMWRRGDVAELHGVRETWRLIRRIGGVDATELEDRVTALAFDRSGMVLAAGSGLPSRNGQVELFSVLTGRGLRSFRDVHSDIVLGLAFSPDNRWLASSAADKTIRLLEVSSGTVVRTLEGHTHHVMAIDWQHDGQRLVSAGADQVVKVWDVETGTASRTISGFPTELSAVDFVPETPQVVAASIDGLLRLSDANNGKAIRNFNAPGPFTFTLAVTPDGSRLLAGGQDGTVRIWTIADGKLVAELAPSEAAP